MKIAFVTLALSGVVSTTLLNGQINVGPNNNITGTYSSVAGGDSNKINAPFSIIAGGQRNTNTANFTSVGGGLRNIAATEFGTIPGGRAATTRSYGQLAYASGALSTQGDAQMGIYVLKGITTSAAQGELFLDPASTQRITVPANGSFLVDLDVIARGTTLASGFYGNVYHGKFLVENQSGTLTATGMTNSLVNACYLNPEWCQCLGCKDLVLEFASAISHPVASPVIGIGSTGNSLRVLVTGWNETVYWVAVVRTVEVVKP